MLEGYLLKQQLHEQQKPIDCVPIAKKVGMGSVLGYLTAGIVIGPFLLGFIGEEGKDIMHFAEFGVVMMLFLVGLELEPEAFWRMRHRVLGVGILDRLAMVATWMVHGRLPRPAETWPGAGALSTGSWSRSPGPISG